MSPFRVFAVSILLVACAGTAAADVVHAERFTKEFPLDVGGSFWIDNPVGNIEIIGTDTPGMTVSVQKVVTAADENALREGREQAQVLMGGDRATRVVKTIIPPVRTSRWRANVGYSIRVPRTVHVKVTSNASDRIRVANIGGNVTIKNVNGNILLENVTGSTTVDSSNGTIYFYPPGKLGANAQLVTINGQIEVKLASDANLEWIADTIGGDFLTTFPVRGRFEGSAFHGSINAPGGPTLKTATMMGSVVVLQQGSRRDQARSVRGMETVIANAPRNNQQTAMLRRKVAIPVVQGSFNYSHDIGDIDVGEIRGNARVETGAGAIALRSILGESNVTTNGGPIDLGDAFGWVVARTGAGNVLIHAAREGGLISTGGGAIRLIYSGGPTNLNSAGGDIVINQLAGPVTAETRSGDITITVDANAKTQRVEAKTARGNVLLRVSPRFAADVEVTVLTNSADAETIVSDLAGLSITREQVGNKTRVRATGKLNGGGEKVEITAEDGRVQISAASVNPITVMAPR